MKTWSNRAVKTASSSVRCTLEHAPNSAESADSFMERWALQLAHYWGSGTAQKSVVEYQLYMESQRSNYVESIDRLLHSILQLPGSVQFVLAFPDREIAPQISPSRKYSQPLFSMKAWSDRAKKTSLSSVRGPLRHIRISDELAHSFLERWARQLAYYWGSGTGQKPFVQYGLETESQCSKSIESINRPFSIYSHSLGPCSKFWHLQIQKWRLHVSQYRKPSEPLFSMKTWSDRVKKTSLGSVRCALEYIRISEESAHSFRERWARQLAYYRGSGTGQKSILQYQL